MEIKTLQFYMSGQTLQFNLMVIMESCINSIGLFSLKKMYKHKLSRSEMGSIQLSYIKNLLKLAMRTYSR